MKSSVSLVKSTAAGFDGGGGLAQLTSATATASGRKRCISVTVPSALFPRVFVGGHFIGPRGHSAEPDVDLYGRLVGSGAVPVEHIRRRVVALTRTELPYPLIALLHPHPPLLDQQQLSASV